VKKTLLGVLVIGLMTAADEKKPDDVKDKLKGTWVMVSIEFGGMKVPDDVVKGQSITFEDDKATQRDKDKVEPMTYKIDASKKPAELDMTPTEGSGKGKTAQLIFQLDGDTLKIAGKMKPGRPKGFDDKDLLIMTLKREKK
jgi:uncharacterized protein (TIGR03067 family)